MLTRIRTVFTCLILLVFAPPVLAQANWPDRPVKIVVGFTAGSSTDVTARMFAQKFSEAWGQPVIVENVAGNSGAIGVDRVAKAAPDGYTLMWSGNAAITILPSMQALPFDPLKDLTPISTSLVMPSLFMVNNDLPVKSIPELIGYAKANPGKLSYGTPGVGTPQHIAGELFCFLAGIRMEHIPYRGANMVDLMSGVVQVGIQNAGAAMPLVRDGRVRGIAVTSLKRTPGAPDLPTLAEQGFPGFEATSWFALLGPADLPKPIVDKVRAESLKVLADREMKEKFTAMGLDLMGSTPEETRAAIAADIPKWAKVIKDANIRTGQ
ncbi:MAG: tripartite tricarboxylate transporter substrate binding protein [Reyranella sp.]|uniref:Bug family tripartite tricarboxylate transporter substrate binding protein n=1 Tax=Reyranella sp. TaxID=1929291 RepID=UPI001210A6AD|nr:tripartite tricarboxylate transporter substrate binding protein [Reyranella sp.]TAJ94943.1 MAG: tripartite tricarboxylate transporter substrate binding protein [Reyranella sp.]